MQAQSTAAKSVLQFLFSAVNVNGRIHTRDGLSVWDGLSVG